MSLRAFPVERPERYNPPNTKQKACHKARAKTEKGEAEVAVLPRFHVPNVPCEKLLLQEIHPGP